MPTMLCERRGQKSRAAQNRKRRSMTDERELLKRETISDGRHRGVIDDKTPDDERERDGGATPDYPNDLDMVRTTELRWNWAYTGTVRCDDGSDRVTRSAVPTLEQCWCGRHWPFKREWHPVPISWEAPASEAPRPADTPFHHVTVRDAPPTLQTREPEWSPHIPRRPALRQQIGAILAPAIDTRAPYAKVMIDRLVLLFDVANNTRGPNE